MMRRSQTVFHITHWKAGSQWIAEILKYSAPERFVPWEVTKPRAMQVYGTPSFYIKPLIRGKIYGTVYLTRDRFNEVVSGLFWRTREGTFIYPRRIFNNWINYRIMRSPCRCFAVIRDLRDTLVSLYFSIKNSHRIANDRLARIRHKLDGLSQEEGLLYLLNEELPTSAAIQSSWIGVPGVLLLRYEDILGNELAFFENLIEYCEINVSRERLYDIVSYNIFEVAAGRKRGEEDVNAHLRKGIAGDWHNYFTERLKIEFKRQYGKLLVETSYEKDINW